MNRFDRFPGVALADRSAYLRAPVLDDVIANFLSLTAGVAVIFFGTVAFSLSSKAVANGKAYFVTSFGLLAAFDVFGREIIG